MAKKKAGGLNEKGRRSYERQNPGLFFEVKGEGDGRGSEAVPVLRASC